MLCFVLKVRCLSFVVFVYVVCCVLFIACCVVSFVVSCFLFVVYYLLRVACWLWFDVGCLLFEV